MKTSLIYKKPLTFCIYRPKYLGEKLKQVLSMEQNRASVGSFSNPILFSISVPSILLVGKRRQVAVHIGR
jgi:hypothetical protein